MKSILVPAAAGLALAAALPAHAACLSDVTKFEERMEAYWQSTNYEPTDEASNGSKQQRLSNEDEATSESPEGRTSETAPATTEDAKKADDEKQARANPEAAEEATDTMRKDMVENGMRIKEEGGTTTYAAGGPALPTENWFGDPPRRAQVVEKLEEAREFAEAGDEQACVETLTDAQKLASDE